MVQNILIMSYIAHFIGDFFLQSNYIASLKTYSYHYTFIHSCLYAIPYLILWILLKCDIYALWYVTILVLSHAGVDLLKCYISIAYQKTDSHFIKKILNSQVLFVIDQIIHFVIIYITTLLLQDHLIHCQSLLQLNNAILGIILYIIVFLRPSYIAYKVIVVPNTTIHGILSLKQMKLTFYILSLSLIYGYSNLLGVIVSVGLFLIIWLFTDKNDYLVFKSFIFIAIVSCLYKEAILFLIYL